MGKLPTIPERFLSAYQHVQHLEQDERYYAALIFGSLARGESTAASDMDVKVVVDEGDSCTNINHPIIDGVKLDISFCSLAQLQATTLLEIERRERIPLVAESLILFDKIGELKALQANAQQIRPLPVEPHEYQFIQFMFYHGNDKVARNLPANPVTALLVMHVGLNDFLHYHYRFHQRWWVSSKRLLTDLRSWDAPLAHLIEQFVVAGDVEEKFRHWSAIIDHILQPLGGQQPITENNCACENCQQNLAALVKFVE